MKTKKILAALLLALVQSAALAQNETVKERPLGDGGDVPQKNEVTLASVLRTVRENNPTLKAVRAKWEMMLSLIHI